MADPFSFNIDTVQLPKATIGNVDKEADRMADFFRQQIVFEKQLRAQQEKQKKAEANVVQSADFGQKIVNFDQHIDSLLSTADQRAKATRGSGLNDKEKEIIIKSEYNALGKDLRASPLNRKYTSDYSTILVDDVIKRHKTPKEAAAQSSGIIGGLGDIALSLGQGAIGSVKSLTDLAGAGNVVSQSLDDVNKWLQENKTDASKAERKKIEEAIKKAEASGSTKEEIFAYLGAFKDQPLEMLAQGLGSFATLGAGKAAQALKLANMTGKGVTAAEAAAKAAEVGRNVNIAVGTAQGVGAVKGSQYEVAFKEAKKSGLSDEQAAAIANDAQAYTIDNAGRQVLGGALGLVATATGPIEKAILGKAVEKQGSLLARTVKGAATEAATEAAQEAQSAEAGNVAAINAGLLDPSQRFRGVAGSAAQAGVLGGILGAGGEVMTPGIQQAPPVETQPNGPITPDPVAPTSARQAADWRNQISQGKVPAEIQAWSQQNQIPVEEAVQIHQQALGAPDANPGQILAAANGAPTKFFQGVDLDTISQVEVPIGDGADAITGPDLVAQINEAVGIIANAQSRPKTSYQGYVNTDAVTEVNNAKEFLKSVQKSVTANPQILTQAKQAFVQKQAQPAAQPVNQPVNPPTQPVVERTADQGGEQPAGPTDVISRTAEALTSERPSTGAGLREMDRLVGQVVDYNGTIGELTKDQNGYYVDGQLVESGMSDRMPADLGITAVPQGQAEAIVAGREMDRQTRELAQTAPTDIDAEAEALVAEMESLFGVEMTNQMIDTALAQLGGGANFQQQIEAIRNEFNRQLEEITKPTSGGGQPSENATEGGATGGTQTLAEDEAATEPAQVTQEVNAPTTEGVAGEAQVTEIQEVTPAEPVEAAAEVDGQTDQDVQKLQERKQLLLDMSETKRSLNQKVPDAWTNQLAEIEAKLRGDEVKPNEIYSVEVEGHPTYDGSYPILRNLIPLKITSYEAANKALNRAQDLYSKILGERAKAEYELKIAKTSAQKKKAQENIKKINNEGATQDALDALRDETIPELERLVDEAEKQFGPNQDTTQGEQNATEKRKEVVREERIDTGEGLQGDGQDRNIEAQVTEGGDQTGGGNRVQQAAQEVTETAQEAAPTTEGISESDLENILDTSVNQYLISEAIVSFDSALNTKSANLTITETKSVIEVKEITENFKADIRDNIARLLQLGMPASIVKKIKDTGRIDRQSVMTAIVPYGKLLVGNQYSSQNKANRIGSTAHEFGHFIDGDLDISNSNGWNTAHQQLKNWHMKGERMLDYPFKFPKDFSEKQKKKEAFAQAVSLYFTRSDDLLSNAPEAHQVVYDAISNLRSKENEEFRLREGNNQTQRVAEGDGVVQSGEEVVGRQANGEGAGGVIQTELGQAGRGSINDLLVSGQAITPQQEQDFADLAAALVASGKLNIKCNI